MRSLYIAILCSISLFGVVLGQTNETRILKKEIRLSPSILSSQVINLADFIASQIPDKDVFNQRYFRLIRFNKVLSKTQRNTLSSFGVEIEGYVPYNAYLLSIPSSFSKSSFSDFGPLNIVSLSTENKITKQISNALQTNQWPAQKTVTLLVQCYISVDQNLVESDLKTIGKFSKYGSHKRTYSMTIEASKISVLAEKVYVKHIGLDPGTPIPDDTKGRSLHRSNTLNTDYLGGLKYDGKGVAVAIADDGKIGPHIDLKGRLTNFCTVNNGTHGDMTSGICVGAANLDPRHKGMATGSHLYLYDIGAYPQINNAIPNFNNLGTVITSTSYSQGCNEYTANSEDGDNKLYENTPLMFVFSGGNNGGGDCGYGAGSGWGNITGGYKNGKNTIATGNIDANGLIDPTSSKGPAPDGRIKPDICANGRDQMSTDENYTYQVGGGTSAASPGLAGVMAQLYQAWRELKAEPNPDGALMKAILMNTADELGNVGPDFTYGWGRINALKALKTIQENRYEVRSAIDGDSILFPIIVPPGAQNLKVMIYWADPAGIPNSEVNLINNLDLTVKKPDGTLAFPWKLKTEQIASSLSAPAGTGIDSLNNMEQVSINVPQSGIYTVRVKGTSIPEGPQKFYIVYQIENSGITVTYPIGGEGFVPGETEVIRWDAFGNSGTFNVAYSADSGQTWNTVATAASTIRQQAMTVPNIQSGRALIRVTRGTDSDVSDQPFSIVAVPSNLRVVSACIDSLTIAWNPVAGAAKYEISRLGQKYMDSVGTTTGTQLRFRSNVSDTVWYSVRAVFGNGNKGRRAIAKQKMPGLSNCIFSVDAQMLKSIFPSKGIAYNCNGFNNYKVRILVKNGGISPISNLPVSYKLGNLGTIEETITSTIIPGDSLEYEFTNQLNLTAATTYKIVVKTALEQDLNYLNDSLLVNFITGGIPANNVVQDFQLVTFPPSGWLLTNMDASTTWVRSPTVTGPSGIGTYAAKMNNYTYNAAGSKDILTTPLIDLSAFNQSSLIFDRAYASRLARKDSLLIYVSVDCGKTFLPTGYAKGYAQLATVAATTTTFTPINANQWKSDTVNLSAFSGNKILIQFVSIGRFGNVLYLDNIRTSSIVAVEEKLIANQLRVFPNPATSLLNIELPTGSGITNYTIIGADGRSVQEETLPGASNSIGEIAIGRLPAGVYTILLHNGHNFWRARFSKK